MRVIAFSIILCLTLFSYGNLSAQETLPIRQWLSEGKIQLEQSFDQSIRNPAFRPAWVEKIEIRTETDEFELNRQEYTLRLTPSTPAIRKAQKNLIRLNTQEASLYVTELREELINILLDDFVEIYRLSKEQKLNQELQFILGDQEKVAKRMIQQADFNPKKLLEIEEDLHKLQIEIFDQDLKLSRLLENRSTPLFGELIEVSEIVAKISQLARRQNGLDSDEKYQLKQEILNTEMQAEKAEKSRIIDFVQARYQGPHDDVFNERFSIGLGIELPFSGSSKTKLEQIKLEKWKLEQEASMQLQLESMEVQRSAAELDMIMQKWDYSNKILQQSIVEFKQIEESSRESEWKSPELLLYKKAQQVERKMDLLALEVDIYKKYVNILQKMGLTADDSYMDYLLK